MRPTPACRRTWTNCSATVGTSQRSGSGPRAGVCARRSNCCWGCRPSSSVTGCSWCCVFGRQLIGWIAAATLPAVGRRCRERGSHGIGGLRLLRWADLRESCEHWGSNDEKVGGVHIRPRGIPAFAMQQTSRTEGGPLAARLLDRAVGASLSETAPKTRRTLLVLAGVLVLDWADRNIVGGLAPELRRDLHISNSQLGLLAASFSIVGGVASLPLGWLVDRVRRLVLLAAAVAFWSLAMLAVGAAQSFLWLFGARLLLGAIAATAGPATPSLVGDLVPEAQRGRVLGLIDSGQLLGTGVGYVMSAFVVAYLSWRWGFWLLAIPGALVVVLLHRLPEPARTQPRRRRRRESYPPAPRTVGAHPDHRHLGIAPAGGQL